MAIDDDALGDLLDEIGLELNSAGPAIEPLLAALIGDAPAAGAPRGCLWVRASLADLDQSRGRTGTRAAR